MIVSPEFRRTINEQTWHTLLLMPITIAGIYATVYLSSLEEYRIWQEDVRKGIVAPYALNPITEGCRQVTALLVFLYMLVWGGRKASDGFAGEIIQGSWDFQRLSVCPPWMLWMGKVFGGPVLVWYSATFVGLAFLFGCSYQFPYAYGFYAVCGGMAVVLANICLNGIVVLLLHQNRRQITRNYLGVVQASIALALTYLLFSVYDPLLLSAFGDTPREPVYWYRRYWDAEDFMLASMLFFSLWSGLGLYRCLCVEMEGLRTPVSWLGFLLSATLYITGFTSDKTLYALNFDAAVTFTPIEAGFVLCLLAVYVTLPFAPKDIGHYRRMNSASYQSMRSFSQHVGLWVVAFWLMTGFLLVAVLGEPDSRRVYVLFSFWLYCVRDVCIFHYLYFIDPMRKPDVTAFVYVAILYVLVPQLLIAAGLPESAELLLVDIIRPKGYSLMMAVFQVVLVGGLLTARVRALARAPVPLGRGLEKREKLPDVPVLKILGEHPPPRKRGARPPKEKNKVR